ncbi:MAG: DUF2817 domain-containing protein [Acidiferrobacterales bacterium]
MMQRSANPASAASSDEFAADYFSARKQFLRLASNIGAQIASYPIGARGPAGEHLSIDTAHFSNAASKRLLVLTSGVHGAEGLAGSALQQYLLRTRFSDPRKQPACTVLFVHAVNPYGFAHIRRANENNVDLNRNCITRFPGPDNPAYADFDFLLNPRAPLRPHQPFLPQLLWLGIRRGPRTARQAIAGGQYAFPRGLFYGGAERQQSTETLYQILRMFATQQTRHVLHIDIHTGLGKYGYATLLAHEAPGSDELCQLQAWLSAERVLSSYAAGATTYAAIGTLGWLTKEIFAHAKVYAATMELGTYSLLHVLSALRRENQYHHYGAADASTGLQVKADLLQAFCPADARWRARVLQHGARVFREAALGLQLVAC